MKQIGAQTFESECGRARLTVENEMPVGQIHDFVMMLKGHMVDLMKKVHEEEKKAAEKIKEIDEAGTCKESCE